MLRTVGLVELDFSEMSTALAVDDQAAAPLLADLGEDELELLAVDLEDRRAQLDLGAFGQRRGSPRGSGSALRLGVGSPVRGQCGWPIVANSRLR